MNILGQDFSAEAVIVALCVTAMIAMFRFGARRLAGLLLIGGTVIMAAVLTWGHGAEAIPAAVHLIHHH
jgi:hypothetical protein